MPAPLQKSIAVDILIKITEEFCDFCEKSASLNLERKIFLLSKLLSKLQAAIYDIDEVLPEKLPLDFEPGRPSTGLAKDFLDFGRFEGYTLTLEPYNLQDGLSGAGVGVGSLQDDIADIYKDLKEALGFYYHSPQLKSHTVWHLCDLYFHWGSHLVNAQRVLFEALQNLGIRPPVKEEIL